MIDDVRGDMLTSTVGLHQQDIPVAFSRSCSLDANDSFQFVAQSAANTNTNTPINTIEVGIIKHDKSVGF